MTLTAEPAPTLLFDRRDLTTFPNDEGYDELVLARGIPFHSLCQHHLLPFTGTAWISYIPDPARETVVGLSKLPRLLRRENATRSPVTPPSVSSGAAVFVEGRSAGRAVTIVWPPCSFDSQTGWTRNWPFSFW